MVSDPKTGKWTLRLARARKTFANINKSDIEQAKWHAVCAAIGCEAYHEDSMDMMFFMGALYQYIEAHHKISGASMDLVYYDSVCEFYEVVCRIKAVYRLWEELMEEYKETFQSDMSAFYADCSVKYEQMTKTSGKDLYIASVEQALSHGLGGIEKPLNPETKQSLMDYCEAVKIPWEAFMAQWDLEPSTYNGFIGMCRSAASGIPDSMFPAIQDLVAGVNYIRRVIKSREGEAQTSLNMEFEIRNIINMARNIEAFRNNDVMAMASMAYLLFLHICGDMRVAQLLVGVTESNWFRNTYSREWQGIHDGIVDLTFAWKTVRDWKVFGIQIPKPTYEKLRDPVKIEIAEALAGRRDPAVDVDTYVTGILVMCKNCAYLAQHLDTKDEWKNLYVRLSMETESA